MADLKCAVRRADLSDLDDLTILFDAYRVFYGQDSDPDRARAFIEDRLKTGDSVMFLSTVDASVAGFVQLYPSFSSVSTSRIWILNDLYVSGSYRRIGVARNLMEHVTDWARKDGAIKLLLETAADNAQAKSLYESLGWVKNAEYDRYELNLRVR